MIVSEIIILSLPISPSFVFEEKSNSNPWEIYFYSY